MAQNVTCISYFNRTTQGNVPFRTQNYYGTNAVSAGGSDDWYSSTLGANEYQCLGIDYTPPVYQSNGTTLITPGEPFYMNFQNWKAQWQDGTCKSLFQEMLLGGATGRPYAAFDPLGFKYVQDDFIFMLSRYFNNDPSSNTKESNIDISGINSNVIDDGTITPATNLNIPNISIYNVSSNKKLVPFTCTFNTNHLGTFQLNDSVTIFFSTTAPNVLTDKNYVQGQITKISETNKSSVNTYSITVNIYNVVVSTSNPPPAPNTTTSTAINWTAGSGGAKFYFTYGLSNGDVWIGTTNNTLSNPGEPGYDTFLDTLLDACNTFPGICEPIQSYMCNACSRDEIQASQVFIKFCGCQAPPDPNSFYNNISNNLDPSCDPLCSNSLAIKNVNPTTGITQQCNANVCVINNVSIKAVDTNFSQAPNFTQVCPSCSDGTGNCVCIIDATFSDITSINDYNGNPINDLPRFNQVCPGAQCFVVDPTTGQYVSKACEDSLYNSKGQLLKNLDLGPSVKFPVWIIVIAGILLLVAFLTFVAYRYQSDNIAVYMVSKTKVY
jgi:hypothetical protein